MTRAAPFDRDVLSKVRERLGLKEGPVVHPSAMFRLFAALWRRRAAVDLVESFSVFRRLTPTRGPKRLPTCRRTIVVAKFYFSKAFPDTQSQPKRLWQKRCVASLGRRPSLS